MSTKQTTTFAFPTTPNRLAGLIADMRRQREVSFQSAVRIGLTHMVVYLKSEAARQSFEAETLWVKNMLATHPTKRLSDQLSFWIASMNDDDHSDLYEIGISEMERRETIAADNRLVGCMTMALDHLSRGRVQEAFDLASRLSEAGSPVPDSLDFNTPMWSDVEIKSV